MTAGEITCDTLFAGALFCSQPRHGYRFSLDALLLAHFCKPRPGDRVLDLGAGCGVVSLILAYRHPQLDLTCLEMQARLAALARRNIEQNQFGGRMRLVRGDLRLIRELLPVAGFDLVVTNPPYFPVASGRLNPNEEQAMARHELGAALPDVVRAAAFALPVKGRLALIYPARRAEAMFAVLRQHRLAPKRLRLVHPYPDAGATHILLEAVKGGGEGLSVAPPLYLRLAPGGEYSPELAGIFSGHC